MEDPPRPKGSDSSNSPVLTTEINIENSRRKAIDELLTALDGQNKEILAAEAIITRRWNEASREYDESMAQLAVEGSEVVKGIGTIVGGSFQELHASNYLSLWKRIDDIFAKGKNNEPDVSSETARSLTVALVASKGYK